ncbi:hypothetical protein [Streptomyces sp. NBC_01306]|uniref:hypothetical protein n=1 Tax=Streptomyces sp. NBC_01306 TaxID=2903819 RepID=UPI0022598CE8|nr:hypothetical protein [Streptomyces sp. NBC_01306]MCX4729228.1 hypothetical protein [Streptomyces sp. NBC_01306]
MNQGEASDAGKYEEFILDIGLSWMASKSEYPVWLPEEEFNRFAPKSGPVDVQLSIVDESITEFERTAGMQIGEDVRRLLDSSLPDEVIRTVWLGVTKSYFDPAKHGMTGRDWMLRIELVWTTSARRLDAAFVPPPPHPVTDAGLRSAVLDQIRPVADELEQAAAKHSVPGGVPALQQVVGEACADPGYRLFLRTMKAYFVAISEEHCEKFLALGERFGYPEFLVDDNLNVRVD